MKIFLFLFVLVTLSFSSELKNQFVLSANLETDGSALFFYSQDTLMVVFPIQELSALQSFTLMKEEFKKEPDTYKVIQAIFSHFKVIMIDGKSTKGPLD